MLPKLIFINFFGEPFMKRSFLKSMSFETTINPNSSAYRAMEASVE